MNKTFKTILWIIWLGLLVWGITGVFQRVILGDRLVNYGSYVPWGLSVAAYIYFVGLSAGAFLLSSLIYVFRIQRLEKIGRISLFIAAITLVMGLVSICLDLGHMSRFYEVFTRPSFSSMMAWMVWLYTAYFILILIELWFELRCDLAKIANKGGVISPLYRFFLLGWKCPEDPEAFAACQRKNKRWLGFLGAIGIPLTITFSGGVGALFATLAARPYWNHSIYPIFFLTGALLSGGALLLTIVAMSEIGSDEDRSQILHFLSRFILGLLIFDLLLEWSEFSIPMWYQVGLDYALLMEVLTGEFWYNFWIIHIVLGTIIPLVLLIWKPASRWAMAVSGGLIAVTYLSVRLNIVVPGLVTPAFEGLRDAYVDKRLMFEYIPSAFEWSLVAFAIATGIGLFYLGKRYLPLIGSHNPVS